MSVAEPQPAVPKPSIRWYQYRLRTLLLLPIVVVIGGIVIHRIEHNRAQREAVHDLWRMGARTADGPGQPLLAPLSESAMMISHREGWLENLQGTHEPCAVLFYNDYYTYDAEEIARLLRGVPSIRHVYVEHSVISNEELERLRLLVPDIEIHQATNTPQPQSGSPRGGAGIGKMVN
jgi:hypothetical protein